MKIIHPFAFGILMWTIMTAADAFDEYILNCSTFIGAPVIFASPVLFSILYAWKRVRRPFAAKEVILWYMKFLTTGVIPAFYICEAAAYNHWIVNQFSRNAFLDLNGIEYYLFAFVAIAGFLICTLLFHLIYGIILLHRKKKKVQTVHSDTKIN